MNEVYLSSKRNVEICVNGVKGLSCLIAFNRFDIINNFGLDYMHAILLGVMKKFIDLWCNPKYKSKSFYIKEKDRNIINNRLVAIKPCSYITRKPKPLLCKNHFTASELKSHLLYFLPICLTGVLPSNYLNHFQLLSFSAYILLSTEITQEQLNQVEANLKSFIKDFEIYYGKENMVMNIHLLWLYE